MKHIKLFEEISTPINPELLGVMNNAETLTRKAFSILFDKYVRNNDKASIFHLMKLANKYHREWFYDENFLDKIAVTLNNYNMEPEDFDSREWLGTPAEREKMEREYTESKARLEKSLIFNFFIYGSQEGNPKAKSVPQKMGLDRLISYLSGYGVAGGSVSHGVDPSSTGCRNICRVYVFLVCYVS